MVVSRGSKKTRIIGYNNLSTSKGRTRWYALPELHPSKIAMPELYSMRFLTFFSEVPFLADHLFDVAYPTSQLDDKTLYLYLNSTIYLLMLELWSPRMGGGGGALHPRTIEFKTIPVPNLTLLKSALKNTAFGQRETKIYFEEVNERDRMELDGTVLQGMGFEKAYTKELFPRLYKEYVELVQDRLIKAGKNISDTISAELELTENSEDEDND